jgi:hypothetical protein
MPKMIVPRSKRKYREVKSGDAWNYERPEQIVDSIVVGVSDDRTEPKKDG